jgi:hypothetical protein
MTMSRFTPPLEYLQAASRSSLQSFELARLNHAANLRSEIAALIDQWIQESSEAVLARWMLDHHQSLQAPPICPADIVRTLIDSSPTTLFPDSPMSPRSAATTPPTLSSRSAASTPPALSSRSTIPTPSSIPARPSNIFPAPPRFTSPAPSLPRKSQKQRQSSAG